MTPTYNFDCGCMTLTEYINLKGLPTDHNYRQVMLRRIRVKGVSDEVLLAPVLTPSQVGSKAAKKSPWSKNHDDWLKPIAQKY